MGRDEGVKEEKERFGCWELNGEDEEGVERRREWSSSALEGETAT